jgi:hypothetical protein
VKVSRRRTALLTTAAALLLSACGSSGTPGVAADVAGDRITDEQVDEFARVLCALGGLPGTQSGTPSGEARYRSLEILLADELAADIADLEGVDRQAVDAAVQQMNATRDSIPEGLRDTFDEVALEFSTAQNAIIELGRESLVEQGQDADQIGDDAAYAEGERLRQEYAQSADVEVDPRFGTLVDGVLQPGDGSLSVPVSDIAVAGAAEQPTEELVSLLPASQKCG